MKMLVVVITSLLAAGCAIKPEKVHAASPDKAFDGMTCEQLATEKARIEAELIAHYAAQRKIRSNDIDGMMFVGLPSSAFINNKHPDAIAELKGDAQALDTAGVAEQCYLEPVRIPAPIPKKATHPVYTGGRPGSP